MSTDFILIKNTSKHLDLNILEHSCMLDLYVSTPHNSLDIASNLTPQQVKQLAIQMLEIASYSTSDPEEFAREVVYSLKHRYDGIGPLVLE